MQFRDRKRLRLFFPFATRYAIGEFGAYLSYRGLQIEGVETTTGGLGSVVLATSDVAKDGPCIDGRPMICYSVRTLPPTI
jgi:hypothetical protein